MAFKLIPFLLADFVSKNFSSSLSRHLWNFWFISKTLGNIGNFKHNYGFNKRKLATSFHLRAGKIEVKFFLNAGFFTPTNKIIYYGPLWQCQKKKKHKTRVCIYSFGREREEKSTESINACYTQIYGTLFNNSRIKVAMFALKYTKFG